MRAVTAVLALFIVVKQILLLSLTYDRSFSNCSKLRCWKKGFMISAQSYGHCSTSAAMRLRSGLLGNPLRLRTGCQALHDHVICNLQKVNREGRKPPCFSVQCAISPLCPMLLSSLGKTGQLERKTNFLVHGGRGADAPGWKKEAVTHHVGSVHWGELPAFFR